LPALTPDRPVAEVFEEFSMDGIFELDRTMALLTQVLNIHAFRHSVIAANIANVDTPGYQPFDVIYADKLRVYATTGRGGGLAWTHPRHFPDQRRDRVVEPTIVPAQQVALGSVTEGVDIDREMVDARRNALMYTAMARRVSDNYQLLSMVLR